MNEPFCESPDQGVSLIWPIQRVHQDNSQSQDEHVVVEEPLEITINGQSIAVLMRMPGREKELAAGFCISEGYVRRVADILLIHHCGQGHPAPNVETDELPGSRNRVEIRVAQDGFVPPERSDMVRLIRSGCGAADTSVLSETLPVVRNDLRVPAPLLLGLVAAMRDLPAIHREVGGTHSAAVFDTQGQAVIVAEDIGRHNAVDKAVGYCLLWSIPLGDKILITSGRTSYEMAVKAIRTGIPIIASLSAPTSLAVQLAHDRGLTLIGYLRGGRMNVYTHPHRIVVGPKHAPTPSATGKDSPS